MYFEHGGCSSYDFISCGGEKRCITYKAFWLGFCYAYLFCIACRMIIDEVEAEIKKTDPNEKLEIGSFRVNPTGDQLQLKEVSK